MIMKRPVIFVSTCEFSGDMHGEVLIREIRKKAPDAVFYGIGGPLMAKAGMDLIDDPTKQSTIGFIEALKNFSKLKRLIKTVVDEWEKRRPDLILWLDSGGFNLLLAKEAKERGIPVICMFSPSAWAYGEDRAVKMADRIKLLLAIFPFEAEFYRKFGVNAVSVGHPLIDRVKNDLEPKEFRLLLGVKPGQKLVGLLPGSRRQEISRLLGPMLEAASIISREQDIKWVLPKAASLDRKWLETIIKQYPLEVEIRDGDVYNLLAAADGAVVASGTASLEAAILNTPTIIVYQVSKLSFFIYRMMISDRFKKQMMVGSPNIIMERMVLPELLQENMNAANIARYLRLVLNEPEYSRRMREDLRKMRELIGPPGVMERAAGLILKEINK